MSKVLKGLGIAALAIIAVVVGSLFIVGSNLNQIVAGLIETEGSKAVGTAVTVSTVDINLVEGRASIFGLSVANPEGYSEDAMLSFDELSVTLDIKSLAGDLPRITSIVTRNPRLLFESKGTQSNLETIARGLQQEAGTAAPTDSAAQGPRIAIDHISIDNIEASLKADILPGALTVDLGDISLEGLEGRPEDIADQVVSPLISQLSRNALAALAKAAEDLVMEEAKEKLEGLEDGLKEKVDGLEDQLKEKVDEKIGEDLRKGLGDLLKRR